MRASADKWRYWQRVLFLFGIACLPFCLCPCGFFLHSSIALVQELTIDNQTTETIIVTPVIDAYDAGRHLLPMTNEWMGIPPIRYGRYKVLPGRKLDITYDWGDQRVAFVFVEDSEGNLMQAFLQDARYPLVIDDLQALQTIDPVYVNLAKSNSYAIFPYLMFFLSSLGPLLLLLVGVMKWILKSENETNIHQ